MAKIRPSASPKISGKIGGQVFVDSGKYGEHAREAQKNSKKKKSDEFENNKDRSPQITKLVASIYSIFKRYSRGLSSTGLYTKMLSIAMSEISDNRFVLLHRLNDIDLNPRYPFNNINHSDFTLTQQSSLIRIEIKGSTHPPVIKQADCYSYEFTMLTWNNKHYVPQSIRKGTKFESMLSIPPDFEIIFELPKDTLHWLLCVKIILGSQGKSLGLMNTESTKIMQVGTFDESDYSALAKSNDAIKAAEKIIHPAEEEMERVGRKN